MSVKDHTNILRKMNAIYNAANFLQENFVGKKVTYVGEESTVSVIFSHTNFMHLCGIDYRRGSALFFQDALVEKIDLQDVKIKIDSTTFQKLQVVGSLKLLLSEDISIVNNGVYSSLRYDAAIRTRKKILALSLKRDGLTYVPISLLNLTSKEVGSGQKVTHIFSEDLISGERKTIMEIADLQVDSP